MQKSGFPQSREKSGENRIFSRLMENSGNSSQEILNSTSKSVKRRGIVFLASHQVWERVSSLAKVMLFSKDMYL